MAKVYVSIGSNVDREENIQNAIRSLTQRFGRLSMSEVYESKAVGFDGDNFFNLVVAFDAQEAPEVIVSVLHDIEHQLGRNRIGRKFSSRTVDLDILLYGDLVANTDEFHVPREEITEHAFVLWPLAEIAGDQRHPVTGERFRDLWKAFDRPNQDIWVTALSPGS